MAEDAYFVHLKDPVDFRRTILESSREVIHMMQEYQALMDLRKRRLDMEQAFKEELREIMLLVNKLEKTLPKHSINKLKEVLPGVIEEEKKHMAKPEKKKLSKKKEKPAKEQLREKQLSQIQRLEKALESVEGKLHKL
jgi:hypothetical protein